ncbi:hypothetical protein M3J09_006371 [Ascochyta lentis]
MHVKSAKLAQTWETSDRMSRLISGNRLLMSGQVGSAGSLLNRVMPCWAVGSGGTVG